MSTSNHGTVHNSCLFYTFTFDHLLHGLTPDVDSSTPETRRKLIIPVLTILSVKLKQGKLKRKKLM